MSPLSSNIEECLEQSPEGIPWQGKKVLVGKDQEKAQSEKDSHSKNRDGKKLN